MKRMKALRFHLIGLPGRVVSHARKLIIRLAPGPGVGELHHRPSDHPDPGMWTGRM